MYNWHPSRERESIPASNHPHVPQFTIPIKYSLRLRQIPHSKVNDYFRFPPSKTSSRQAASNSIDCLHINAERTFCTTGTILASHYANLYTIYLNHRTNERKTTTATTSPTMRSPHRIPITLRIPIMCGEYCWGLRNSHDNTDGY